MMLSEMSIQGHGQDNETWAFTNTEYLLTKRENNGGFVHTGQVKDANPPVESCCTHYPSPHHLISTLLYTCPSQNLVYQHGISTTCHDDVKQYNVAGRPRFEIVVPESNGRRPAKSLV